jgi:hypothetical protein
MQSAFILPAAAILLAAVASAQSHGYVFAAPGGTSTSGHTEATLQIGAGGEAVFGKGIGLGAEIGYVAPAGAGFSNGLGAGSVNGYYHFRHGRSRLDPFVTGGYTVLFRSGSENLFNVGGGVNWWFLSHLGLKLEFRDQIYARSGESLHFWGIRFGLNFR